MSHIGVEIRAMLTGGVGVTLGEGRRRDGVDTGTTLFRVIIRNVRF